MNIFIDIYFSSLAGSIPFFCPSCHAKNHQPLWRSRGPCHWWFRIQDSNLFRKRWGFHSRGQVGLTLWLYKSICNIHPDGYCWILLRWIRSKNIGCRALLNKVLRRCRFRRLFTKSWSRSIEDWRTEWRRRAASPLSSTASRSRRTTRPRSAASKLRRKHSWWLPGFVFIYLQKEEIYENFVSFSVQKMLEKELHPLAEKWSKVKLEHTSTYGIRWNKVL